MKSYIVRQRSTHPTYREIFVDADSPEQAEELAANDNHTDWQLETQMPETTVYVESVEENE